MLGTLLKMSGLDKSGDSRMLQSTFHLTGSVEITGTALPATRHDLRVHAVDRPVCLGPVDISKIVPFSSDGHGRKSRPRSSTALKHGGAGAWSSSPSPSDFPSEASSRGVQGKQFLSRNGRESISGIAVFLRLTSEGNSWEQ